MADTRTLNWSFSGGEMSPEMFGHADDIGYRTGAARMRNMIATPRGPARRRPGFARCAASLADSDGGARLITFRHSVAQAFAVEVGYNTSSLGYIRLHSNGAPITFADNVADDDPLTWTVQAFYPQEDVLVYTPASAPFVTSIFIKHDTTAPGQVDTVNDRWNIPAHDYLTGDPVAIVEDSGASFPAATPSLSSANTYYIIKDGADHVKLAESHALALLGTAIVLTGTGAGNTFWTRRDYIRDGDAIRLFGAAPGPLLPSPLSASTTYYAAHSDAGGGAIALHHTREGAIGGYSTDLVESAAADVFPGTTLTVPDGGFQRRYLHGELIEGEARASGTYYTCKTEHSAASFVSGNWLAQDASNTYTISSPYLTADLFDVAFTQSIDIMTLAHVDYTQRELRRWSSIHWELATFNFATRVRTPSNVAVAETVGRVLLISDVAGQAVILAGPPPRIQLSNYTVAVSSNPLAKGEIVRIEGLSGRGITDGEYVVERIGEGVPNDFEIAYTNSTSVTTASIGTASGATVAVVPMSSDTTNNYRVTAVDSIGTESLPSDPVLATNNLYVQGAYTTITWSTVEGAAEYRVYKEESGIYGYIGSVDATSDLSFRDDNISPDLGRTVPIEDTSLGTTETPAAVGYYQQRRIFARTLTYPQGVWMTNTGTESDMIYHLPSIDTDRIRFTVSSREAEIIRHIVGVDHLLILTDQSEYRITATNNDVLTPETVDVRPQSHIGSSTVHPIISGKSVLFCANRGGHVFDLGFQLQSDGFVPNDVSMRASHLFDYRTIKDSAQMKAPHPINWFTSSNGYLLGFTYSPEHQIGAWHWHDTNGLFESCCVVPEGDEDRLYVVVNRGGVRSIQRMGAMHADTLADGFFVDDGVTGTGAAISGLSHLDGDTVQILNDGIVESTQVVNGGSVTLASTSTVAAHVGLPYTSEIQTMPMSAPIEALAQGRRKSVSRVWVRIFESNKFSVGPNSTDLTPSDPYAASVGTLVTDQIDVTMLGNWTDDGQITIVQSDPLPLTVVSVTTLVSFGD